jgi:hypothetical protein
MRAKGLTASWPARAFRPACSTTDVEHEISCETSESAWLMRWEDIRPVGSEGPDQVIASAQRRFMAVHQSIVDRAMEPPRAMGQQSPDAMSPRVVLQASQDR